MTFNAVIATLLFLNSISFDPPSSTPPDINPTEAVVPQPDVKVSDSNVDVQKYQKIADGIYEAVQDMLASNKWKDLPQKGITRLKQKRDATFRGSTVAEASPKLLSEEIWFNGEDTPEWHKDVASVKVLRNVTDQIKIQYNTAHEQANGLVKPRDFVTLNYYLKEGDTYYIVFKSIEYEDMPEQEGFVRATNGVSAMIFEPMENEPDKTKFTFLMNTDFNLGWAGRMLTTLYPTFVQAYLAAVVKLSREL